MNETHFRELAVLSAAGLGLAVFGLFQFAAGVSRRWLAVAGGGLATGGAGVAAGGLLDGTAGWAAAALTAAISAGFLALGTARLTTVLHTCRRPSVRAGGLAVVGLALLAGGVIQYDLRDESDLDSNLAWLHRMSERPPTQDVAGLHVTTDQGRRFYPREATCPRSEAEMRALTNEFAVQIPATGNGMVRSPASDVCNCHGWVFTGGRYWLSPQDVLAILGENGYTPVIDAVPGDLAIYRTGDEIVHTAVVRAVGPDIPVLVEGKWGWMGVYLHPVDSSCYGKGVTYYRSPREGHLLVGLGGNSPADRGSVRAVDDLEMDGQ